MAGTVGSAHKTAIFIFSNYQSGAKECKMNFKLILWLSCFLPIIKSQSVYNFKKIPTGFVILATDRNIQYRLASTKFYHMSRCFSACSQLQSCVIIQMSLTTCSYYSSNVQLRPGSDGSELWSKPGL